MAKAPQRQSFYGTPSGVSTDYYPPPVNSTRAPTTSDIGYPLGQVWVRRSTRQIYMLAAVSGGSATWALASPGASDVDTLTADSGGALSPAAGNITIAGGTNITTAGAGSTITVNLDAAITVATSVTSATLATSSATAGSNLSGANWAADGTDANINLTVTPKGTGNLDVSTGDLDVQAGNVSLTGAATQLQVQGGAATDFIGQATLVAGTVTVANTNIAATDKIFVQRQGVGASTALGVLDTSISAATSFTITSLQPGTPASTETNDVSVVDYFIVRQL